MPEVDQLSDHASSETRQATIDLPLHVRTSPKHRLVLSGHAARADLPRLLRRSACYHAHRQFLGLQRIPDHPCLHAENYVAIFDGCLSLTDLCVTFKTYLSTFKFCAIVWAVTLVARLRDRLFPRLPCALDCMQTVLFLVCTIPFWTSNVIRMISWIPLLGRNGLVNQALIGAHVIEQPLEWLLYSNFSVMLAFVHLYTFFMIVPIFNAMMRIDRSLLEAARDAGASGWQMVRERRHSAVENRHRDRLDLRHHDRHGRFPDGRRDGRPADRVGRQDHPGADGLPAVSGGRRQRGHPARGRADDRRGA